MRVIFDNIIDGHTTEIDQELSSEKLKHPHPNLAAHSTQANDDLISDTIGFTRATLTSYDLLAHERECELANVLAESSQKIALLLFSKQQSTDELLLLMDDSMANNIKSQHFTNREQYFALRTQMDELKSSKGNSKALLSLRDALQGKHVQQITPVIRDQITAIDWPGPLMIALAKRHANNDPQSSTLGQAIDHYLSHVNTGSFSDRKTVRTANNDKYRTLLVNLVKVYLEARETLVNHNLRLVFYVAKRYTQKADHLLELIQEGSCGLIRAAEKYRPATGNRFSTYAYQWIVSKVRKARVNLDRVITISPEYNNDLIQLSDWFEQHKHVNPSAEGQSLSEKLKNRARLDELKQLSHHCISLDGPSSDEEFSLHTLLPNGSNVFDTISKTYEKEQINQLMNTVLTERECYIINERFGRLNSDPKTLHELSGIMGISRERIRQLEQGALNKLSVGMSNSNSFPIKH